MEDKNNSHMDKDSLEGKYANNFRVGHNAFEFLIDFGQVYEEDNSLCMHTRIITSPNYAKALLKTLMMSINEYESTYGSIKEAPGES
jgi:hypothetical protein